MRTQILRTYTILDAASKMNFLDRNQRSEDHTRFLKYVLHQIYKTNASAQTPEKSSKITMTLKLLKNITTLLYNNNFTANKAHDLSIQIWIYSAPPPPALW